MRINVFSLALVPAVALFVLASCQKAERPAIVEEEKTVAVVDNQDITVAEAVDVLTKSVTKEDLKDLSLFLKQGSADSSIYLKIADGETEMLSGEVSLVAGENYKVIGLNLMVFNALPVVGTIDEVALAVGLAKANLFIWNEEKLVENLAIANSAVAIQVAGMYHFEFRPFVDEESGKTSIEPYLVSNDNPDEVLLISDLIAMFG